jgi:hypothetical protein
MLNEVSVRPEKSLHLRCVCYKTCAKLHIFQQFAKSK